MKKNVRRCKKKILSEGRQRNREEGKGHGVCELFYRPLKTRLGGFIIKASLYIILSQSLHLFEIPKTSG